MTLKVTQQKTAVGVATTITGETFEATYLTQNGTAAELLALAVELEQKARTVARSAVRVRCCADALTGELSL